jgi:hypothetical protein
MSQSPDQKALEILTTAISARVLSIQPAGSQHQAIEQGRSATAIEAENLASAYEILVQRLRALEDGDGPEGPAGQ